MILILLFIFILMVLITKLLIPIIIIYPFIEYDILTNTYFVMILSIIISIYITNYYNRKYFFKNLKFNLLYDIKSLLLNTNEEISYIAYFDYTQYYDNLIKLQKKLYKLKTKNYNIIKIFKLKFIDLFYNHLTEYINIVNKINVNFRQIEEYKNKYHKDYVFRLHIDNKNLIIHDDYIKDYTKMTLDQIYNINIDIYNIIKNLNLNTQNYINYDNDKFFISIITLLDYYKFNNDNNILDYFDHVNKCLEENFMLNKELKNKNDKYNLDKLIDDNIKKIDKILNK